MRTSVKSRPMAFDVRGSFGYSGAFGRIAFGFNRFGFYDWNCGIYQKKYYYGEPYISKMKFYRPTNPRTLLQQSWRSIFTAGSVHWSSFTTNDKKSYNMRAKAYYMTGFNLHQREWLSSHSLPMIFSLKKTLSSAEILALHSTPIEIVPAPGSGKFIDILSCDVKLNYGTTTYVSSGGAPALRNPSSSNVPVSFYNNVLTLTSSQITRSNFSSCKLYENEAIECFVATSNPTTGNGTLDIYITYEIKTL